MLNPDIVKALQSARPFQYLNAIEIDTLIAYCKVIRFETGETVFRQGKSTPGMYIIIEGAATVNVKVLGREVIEVSTLEQGQFFGEVSLIDKAQSPYSVIATSSLECLLISTQYFDMLSLFFAETRYKITKAISEGVCDRLDVLHDSIKMLMAQSHMIERSLFSEVIVSLSHTESISFEEAHIDIHQMKRLPFLNSLSDKEYVELLKYSVLIYAGKNCNIILEDNKNPSYYFIICGAIQTSITEHNKFAKLSVVSTGNIFGSVSFINHSPSIFTYRTCERAVLLKISVANLNLLRNDDIELWYKLYDIICKSFVELERSADKLLMRLNSELYSG